LQSSDIYPSSQTEDWSETDEPLFWLLDQIRLTFFILSVDLGLTQVYQTLSINWACVNILLAWFHIDWLGSVLFPTSAANL